MTRKETTAAVKQRIVEKSIRLFLAKGFSGTSVTDIANSVGIAKGTVYCHFSSKAEILDSILEKYSVNFLDQAIRQVEACEGDFLVKFKVFYKYTTEFGRDHRELDARLAYVTRRDNRELFRDRKKDQEDSGKI